MLGPDGRPSDEAIAYWAQKCARDRAAAALITGPKKLFNDAALAVEKLSADVESYWQSSYGRGTRQIEADLSAIESLQKKLPAEQAELCQSVIGKTRDFLKTEQKIDEISREADSTGPGLSLPVVLLNPDYAASKLNLMLTSAFAQAGNRGRYHDSVEHIRKRLEDCALAP